MANGVGGMGRRLKLTYWHSNYAAAMHALGSIFLYLSLSWSKKGMNFTILLIDVNPRVSIGRKWRVLERMLWCLVSGGGICGRSSQK